MAETTTEAIPPWWENAAIRAALDSGRWDTVVRTAMEATGTTQQGIADATGLSQSQISRIVTGTRRPRQIATVTALADGLGIPRNLVGLADIDKENDTNRRGFIAAAGTAVFAGAVAAGAPGDLIGDLANPTQVYRRAEATTPAALLRPPVSAHLNLLRHLAAEADRDRRATDSRRLHALVSEAAGFAAWLAVDGDDRAAARRYYCLSVEAAHRTRQPLLVVYMIASLAQFATEAGDARNARQLLMKARAMLPANAPPIAAVWLDCVEASTIAQGRDHGALHLLDNASRRLTSAEPVWPWLMRFDAAKLDGYSESVAIRLRRSPGAWSRAPHPLTAPHPKIAAERLVDRANALIELGSPDDAIGLSHTVLDVAHRLRSDRLTRSVLDLRGQFIDVDSSDLTRLDERLSAIYDQE